MLRNFRSIFCLDTFMNGFLTSFLFFIFSVSAFSQAADTVIYSTTYRRDIATVLLFKKNLDLSEPVIPLGSNERLEFHFDVLDGDFETFQYRIIHCDADWHPDNLDYLEYLEGFNDNYIQNYKASFNTLQPYIHYYLEFPNENINFTKSGNYALLVFNENNPDEFVLSHRFFVSENKLNLLPKIKYPTNLDDKYYMQEVDFNLLFNPQEITNPYSNLKVVIEQNHRLDNACKGLKPNFVKQEEMIFNYDDENVFEGGNEFRNIDLTTVRSKTNRVAAIYRDEKFYTCVMAPDYKRTYKKYLNYQDIDGRFIIKTIDQDDWHLESEYVNVYFSVPFDQPFANGDLFLFGGFSDWQLKNRFKMKYNPETRSYEVSAYLKQGYYNYTYLFLKDGEQKAKMSTIEGSHFETENEYIFKIYYKDPIDFYDRLILYDIANSRKSF